MTGAPRDDYERRYMHPDERVIFREKVVSRGAYVVAVVFAALFGGLGVAAIVAAAAGVVPSAAGFGAGAASLAFAAFMGVTGVMFSVFRTMVTDAHVHVHFGWAKRKVPLSAVEAVKGVRLTGFRQGKVSAGLDGVIRTWVGHGASGRGVEIAYHDGSRKHVLTIGSDQADQLVESVERARSAAIRPEARARVDGAGAEEDAALGDADHDERNARR